jgi:SNF2 family DNA or RNA helicase
MNLQYKTTPREYQEEAVQFALEREYFALFLEAGLGKSKITIDVACELFRQGKINAVLIIAPNDVHIQWIEEQVPIHCSVPKVMFAYKATMGTASKRNYELFLDTLSKGALQFLAVNYDLFSGKTDVNGKMKKIVKFVEDRDVLMVLDEATYIKNPKAHRTANIINMFRNNFYEHDNGRKYLASSKPKAKYRTVLTGTPVTNSPFDVYTSYEFLSPNFWRMSYYNFTHYFGVFQKQGYGATQYEQLVDKYTWNSWKKHLEHGNIPQGVDNPTAEYVKTHEYSGGYRNVDELRSIISKHAVIKTWQECLDLPEKIYATRKLTMRPELSRIYRQLLLEYMSEYKDKTLTVDTQLSLLTRLSQVTSGFFPFQANEPPVRIEEKGKIETLLEDLEISFHSRERNPALIVTRFTAEAKAVYSELTKKYTEGVGLYIGTASIPTDPVTAFKDGNLDYLIANSKMVRMGFNFQNCHDTYILSNDYSLETRLQLEKRTHRFGQTSPCRYVDYVYRDTIDEKILEVLEKKGNILDYFTFLLDTLE